MILVYKFDFVFIQYIKISLTDLPRERYYKPEETFCTQVCILHIGDWKPMV